ncbi:nucleotidyltransferase family protein [Wenxinia marina]|nr:GSU2403 family nucleotidyltransferase fold protein [Wenxinia marina]
MIDFHSHVGTSAYVDLLRLLLDERAAEVRGTVEERVRNGRVYLYDKYRVGTQMRSRYLGEATEDLRARLARADALKDDAGARQSARSRLIRLLRAEGYRSVDRGTGSLLSAFEKAGVFRLGGTLVGTVAFGLYENELGVRIGQDRIAQTDDLDIASFERLSVALGDRVEEATDTLLTDLDFAPVPTLDAGRVWRWKQSRSGTLVEFLTPAFGDEGLKELPALGVSAQALNYLNYLIAEPIAAAALYRSGILVQIPRPERFAIHKLIVADRRRDGTDSVKARKDRAQAALLVEVLAEERPDELAEAWEDARGRGPRWRERIDRTLARMPETRARLEAVAG